MASAAQKRKKEELYAEERLKNSPLQVNKKRENQYDLCQCGHTRKDHMHHCFHFSCMCQSFKSL